MEYWYKVYYLHCSAASSKKGGGGGGGGPMWLSRYERIKNEEHKVCTRSRVLCTILLKGILLSSLEYSVLCRPVISQRLFISFDHSLTQNAGLPFLNGNPAI